MQNFIVSWTRSLPSAAGLALLLNAVSPAFAQTCAPIQECGDVDSSGAVDSTDALRVLKSAVGQPESLTCECGEISVVRLSMTTP